MKEFEKALNYAFLLLKYRNRTEKELEEKLSKKKYSKEVIIQTINKLKLLGLVDDNKFSKEFARYHLEKGKGIYLIKKELQKKKIDREIIENTLNELKPTEEEELIRAKMSFDKKIKQCQNLPPEKIYSRVGGFLARKGFSIEIINKLFRHWKKDFEERLL